MARRVRSGSPFSLFSFQDIITCTSGIIILIMMVLAIELSRRKPGTPSAATAQLAADIRQAIEVTQAEIQEIQVDLAQRSRTARELAATDDAKVERDLAAVNTQIKSLEAELSTLRAQQRRLEAENERLEGKRFDIERDRQELAETEKEIENREDRLKDLVEQDRPIYNSRTPDGKRVWLVQVDSETSLIAAAGVLGKPTRVENASSFLGGSQFKSWLKSKSSASDFIFFLVRSAGAKDFWDLKQAVEESGFAHGFDLQGDSRSAIDPEKGAAAG